MGLIVQARFSARPHLEGGHFSIRRSTASAFFLQLYLSSREREGMGSGGEEEEERVSGSSQEQ